MEKEMVPQEKETVSNEDKILTALAYPIWIIALFLLLTDKKKIHFVKYHSWQALVLGICMVAIIVGINIFFGILTAISSIFGVLWLIVSALLSLFGLAYLVLVIIYAVWTYNGKYFTIPVVSDIVKKLVEEKSS